MKIRYGLVLTLAMAFVVGINIAVALRLVGFAPRISLPPLGAFYRLHWYATVLIFVSGIALLLAYPAKALTNPVFYLKLVALTVGLLIAVRFQQLLNSTDQWLLATPRYKQLAWVSLGLWIVTISAGRFLAYTHSVLLASRFF